ncbi:hypothetical protein O2N63_14170 [Aliiroseovarius sp. KMU-50]|uniref:DUF1295 domain-containing protein n=1 Tax=Aliiroseovarius salicola TaxID=3009082 RepID=A0ABT4W5F5_9RHOB|nr:hypothetical protein [Aliiroseovarius sp. KMU-50]MDA5095230.1 hypothetical protein [Aliiroseovarius sp. KMU-50]
MAQSKTSMKRPAYYIPLSSGWVAATAIPSLFFLWPDTQFLSPRDACNLYILSLFLVLAFYELVFLKIHNSAGTGLRFDPRNFSNSAYQMDYGVKMVGLVATLALLTAFYTVADLYKDEWYAPFFTTLSDYWALFLFVIFANVTLSHFSMVRPRDGIWHLGYMLLSLGRGDIDYDKISAHMLSLCVKGFFTPLMYCYLVYDWDYLQGIDLGAFSGFPSVYEFMYRFFFFADLSLVVVGYAFAARFLNSQIRWTESTMLGWVVCILCYAPFWQMFSRQYFDYFSPSYTWGNWLWEYPVLYGIWGTTILALLAIYTMGTMRMGLRFSNLTYRGVSYGFPFNLTKHPQYISKNATWWLIEIPFIAADVVTGLSNCLSLAGVNCIYYLRAKCEERCLRPSPSYRAYERHIAEHGLIARIGKRLKKPRAEAAPQQSEQ